MPVALAFCNISIISVISLRVVKYFLWGVGRRLSGSNKYVLSFVENLFVMVTNQNVVSPILISVFDIL